MFFNKKALLILGAVVGGANAENLRRKLQFDTPGQCAVFCNDFYHTPSKNQGICREIFGLEPSDDGYAACIAQLAEFNAEINYLKRVCMCAVCGACNPDGDIGPPPGRPQLISLADHQEILST